MNKDNMSLEEEPLSNILILDEEVSLGVFIVFSTSKIGDKYPYKGRVVEITNKKVTLENNDCFLIDGIKEIKIINLDSEKNIIDKILLSNIDEVNFEGKTQEDLNRLLLEIDSRISLYITNFNQNLSFEKLTVHTNFNLLERLINEKSELINVIKSLSKIKDKIKSQLDLLSINKTKGFLEKNI